MDKRKSMLKVFKWIFSHFKTANLNIFFNIFEWIFYHYRDFEISEHFSCLENLSHNIFNVKRDFVWFLTVCGDNDNTTGKEPTLYFGFIGGPVFIKDLERPKTVGDLQSL